MSTIAPAGLTITLDATPVERVETKTEAPAFSEQTPTRELQTAIEASATTVTTEVLQYGSPYLAKLAEEAQTFGVTVAQDTVDALQTQLNEVNENLITTQTAFLQSLTTQTITG